MPKQTRPKLTLEETTMNWSKLKIFGSLATGVTALLMSALPASASPPQVITKIDVPGAVVTVASGINPNGTIVGWYCLKLPCNSANTRGFLLQNDVFTYIDLPNSIDHPATGTQPRYISPQGVVIGAYFTLENGATVGSPRFRGFVWYEGAFVYFDAPDLTSDGQPVYDNPSFTHSIIPRSINAHGEIVGCIHDKDQMNSMHGFLLNSETGAFSRLADGMTMNNGITESGEIVGLDFMTLVGYQIDKLGDKEPLPNPQGFQEIDAWDINSRGDIVGAAVANGVQHGFLRSKRGDYSFIDPDGALATTAFSINSRGDVVGNYRDAVGPQCSTTACVHGFLLQRGSTTEVE
jgi:uncharacterized membrane protein